VLKLLTHTAEAERGERPGPGDCNVRMIGRLSTLFGRTAAALWQQQQQQQQQQRSASISVYQPARRGRRRVFTAGSLRGSPRRREGTAVGDTRGRMTVCGRPLNRL